MMTRNSKGFVLTETLIVTAFAIGIITLLYVSVTPMIATYEDMTWRDANIDIVYKLYHLRKMLYQDKKIDNNSLNKITCDDLNNQEYCKTLINYLDIDKYNLYYIEDVKNSLNNNLLDNDVKSYLKKYDNDNKIILLEDVSNHMIAHLKYK